MPLWFPLLVFSPLIADSTLTLITRVWKREQIWQAHHDHCYQRLVRMGWSHRRVALVYYGVMAIAAGTACVTVRLTEFATLGLTMFFLVAYLCLFIWVAIKWHSFQSAQYASGRRNS